MIEREQTAMKKLGELSELDALRRIVPPAGKIWLDIGCGDGTVACQLAVLGAVVTGIEPDPVQAQKINLENKCDRLK